MIFVMAASDFNDVIMEFFDDNDSDEEFLGYTREQIDADMAERARHRLQSVQEEDSDDSCQSSEVDSIDFAIPDFSDGYDYDWLQSLDSICGPVNIPEDFSEGDYFRLFFTDEVFNLFVAETNRYASSIAESRGDSHSFAYWSMA